MQPTEENTYRNGVLDKLDSLKDKIDDLDVKVSYTNGRVRWLEKVAWGLVGAWTVLTLIIIPLVAAYLSR